VTILSAAPGGLVEWHPNRPAITDAAAVGVRETGGRDWVRREVVGAFGPAETEPDVPLAPGTPFARGHTGLPA